MKVQQFSATVGYSGNLSVADKESIKLSSLPIETLLEKGMYKVAFSKALYEENSENQKKVLDYYNKMSGANYSNTDDLKRLFGVYQVPQSITKVKRI